MAAIILVLSCMPCQDTAAMKLEKDHVEDTRSTEQDHQHKDFCSPLCICSCCSSSTISSSTLVIPIFAPQVMPVHNSHYLGAVISISLPVWQPPQLIA